MGAVPPNPTLKVLGRFADDVNKEKPPAPMELTVGQSYRFDLVAPIQGGPNRSDGALERGREKPLHITGKVIKKYPKFYLIAQNNGQKCCMHIGELGPDYAVTKL